MRNLACAALVVAFAIGAIPAEADMTLAPPDLLWPDVAPYAYDCSTGGPAQTGKNACVRAYVRGRAVGVTPPAVEVLCALDGQAVVASASSWSGDILGVELSNFGQVSAGAHNLGCVIDPNKKIAESNEQNNGRTVSVSISNAAPPPGTRHDLAILTLPDRARPGPEPFRRQFDVVVENRGSVDARAMVRCSIPQTVANFGRDRELTGPSKVIAPGSRAAITVASPRCFVSFEDVSIATTCVVEIADPVGAQDRQPSNNTSTLTMVYPQFTTEERRLPPPMRSD